MQPCSELDGIPYHIDLELAVRAIRRRGAKRAVIQLPDGLKPYGWRIVKCLESALEGGVEVYLHLDSTFGACDLHYGQLEATLKPDVIVHVGHSPYPAELAHPALEPQGASVVYVPALSKAGVSSRAVAKAVDILRSYGVYRVGVVTTAQHVHVMKGVASALKSMGLEPVIPRGLTPYLSDSQVLGCDYRLPRSISSRVEGFLYLGGGVFHPLGLYLSTFKPVVRLDPYRDDSDDLTGEGERLYKVRLSKVAEAMGARRWGVIVGLKTGQYRPWLVERLVKAIREAGGEYMLLANEYTSLAAIISIDTGWFDAFVVTSCPRLPTDDLWEYEKPVLTPGEAFMALSGKLEPYRFPW